MKVLNFTRFLPFCCLLLAFSCTDPITVGADLLDDDRASVGFNGAIEIEATTVPNDSVRIFDSSTSARVSRHLFGTVQDDIFGISRREIAVIPRLGRGSAGEVVAPIFTENDSFLLDSLVLILPFDTANLYGNVLQTTMDYELYEIGSVFDGTEDNYSNEDLGELPMLLSSGSVLIDSVERLVSDTLIDPDSITVHHIRIPLPMSIVQRIADADSSNYELDEDFVANILAGLVLRSTSFDAGFIALNTLNTEANLNAYWTSLDNSSRGFYPFDLQYTLAEYSFDRSGSLAEQLLNASTGNAEQTLMEGAGGLMTRVAILNSDTLSGKIVNQAQLEFYLDESTGFDYGAFDPASIVTLFYRDADNRLQVIDDVAILPAGTSVANRQFFIGGDLLTNDDGLRLYQANLSVHLQTIVEEENEPFIYILIVPNDVTPNRVILHGPGSMEFPMTLKVAFTEF